MADTHTSFDINKNHFAKQEILGCVQEVEDAFSLFFNCMQLPTNHYYVPNTVIFNPFKIFVWYMKYCTSHSRINTAIMLMD